jgi:hypothetical protein
MKDKKDSNLKLQSTEQKPFSRRNFVMMAISGAMIVVGFLLMAGGASEVDAYNADIFSTRRIVVGPLFAFLGFVLMAAAIIIRPNKIKK